MDPGRGGHAVQTGWALGATVRTWASLRIGWWGAEDRGALTQAFTGPLRLLRRKQAGKGASGGKCPGSSPTGP